MYRTWRPPPDPDRPNCPYFPGFETEIKSHVPPPPFGDPDYRINDLAIREGRKSPEYSWLELATQTKAVLTYPVMETAPPSTPSNARLMVLRPHAIGNARGPQLVVCTITPEGDKEPFTAMAKIYDALYYPFSCDIVYSASDTPGSADADYSREAAAYEHLEKAGLTGSCAPEYFGSWTCSLPITHEGKAQHRDVRLILIEYLDGTSLRDLFAENTSGPEAMPDASHLSEEYRLEILARALDGKARLTHSGLRHKDCRSRNVVVVPSPLKQPRPETSPDRVVLIDYDHSTLYDYLGIGKLWFHLTELPPNPMSVVSGYSLQDDFRGWAPLEWSYDTKLGEKWLKERFGGSPLYAAIPPDIQKEIDDDAKE